MIKSISEIRVRYCEADKMGYLHHSHYASYFEIGRTAMLQELGINYRQMEDDGIMLPVIQIAIDFKIPFYYNDIVVLHTKLIKLTPVRLFFEYELFDQEGVLHSTATTNLVFVKSIDMKPTRCPEQYLKLLQKKEV